MKRKLRSSYGEQCTSHHAHLRLRVGGSTMNMRGDFDTFAAELLDQIDAVHTLLRALATTATGRGVPFDVGLDTQKPAVEAGEQSSPSCLDNRPLVTLHE
ncbi:hypothetical protein [Methylobacterium sp. Leaf117]|uniref:hypothetical protein n=1 Tax=Methylobacterium sp. Leaf117 TaxID=1736260 RepID=UPI001AEC20C8|nr:hypothetical protein [Methylobacterium sp. Leaf117]